MLFNSFNSNAFVMLVAGAAPCGYMEDNSTGLGLVSEWPMDEKALLSAS